MKRKGISALLALLFLFSAIQMIAYAEDAGAAQNLKTGKYIVTATLLNFRKQAKTDAEILKTLPQGTQLTITSVSNGWGNASVDGVSGWVMMDYLEYVGDIDAYAVNWKVIDVSQFQGTVDWKKVEKSGVDGVILRMGRRATAARTIGADSMFTANYEALLETNLHVGAYFYSAALSVPEALEEAKWVVNKLKNENLQLDMPIFFDVEYTEQAKLGKDVCTNIVKTFCDYLLDNGYYPGVYCSLWWSSNILDMTQFANYAVWIAQYNSSLGYKGRCNMWQFSNTGRVDGISGDVDINECYTNFPQYIADNEYNHIKFEGGHIYGDWAVVTESTCSEHGLESVLCRHCGITLATRILPLKAHVAGDWEVAKQATAYEDGELVQKCEDCGTVLKRQNLRALNSTHVHDYSEWITLEEADCESEGAMGLKCLECGTVLVSHATPRTAHEAAETVIVEPTCTQNGRRVQNCKHCGIQMQYELIAATGHTVSAWTVTKEATETEFGERTGVCTVCKETVVEQIDKKPVKLKGDVNKDGKITAADARSILRFSAKLETPTPEQAVIADVDADGKITAADARTTLRVSAGLIA
ncbi:MAG: dockerin type I domain-containing protein [Oscillospiraceae bacterium]|nr:dockerin type I domain-containing protein [Oscillospiraceae bacterium]